MQDNKVLHIGRASKNIGGKATGGISKHIEDLSKTLLINNISCSIWDFTLTKSYSVNGINVFGLSPLNMCKGLFFAFFKLKILFSKQYRHLNNRNKFIVSIQSYQLLRIIKTNNFKTIHVHSLNRPIVSFLRAMFPNLNIIVTDHGFWQKLVKDYNPKSKVYQNIEKNISVADRVITISNYATEQFKKHNLSTEKNVFVPNPVAVSEIPILKDKIKGNIIFFNGYNKSIEVKNLVKLIEALQTDSFFNTFKLIAIVDKAGREYLQNLKLNFELEILGAQPWSKIVELYNKSKILVVPSKSESFGLVYLEALAVGTPIVGFYKTVSEFETVLQEDIGELYNDKNETVDELAAKIKKTLSKNYNPEILRQAVKNNYDWNILIHKFIELYKFQNYEAINQRFSF